MSMQIDTRSRKRDSRTRIPPVVPARPSTASRPATPAEPAMPCACQSGGCGGQAAPARPVPPSFGRVCVNGVEIPPEAIAREIQHHPAPDAEGAWRQAARALAVRELLLQEAARRGIRDEPEADEAGRIESAEDARIRALLDCAVEPAQADEGACLRYYETRRERFRTADLFEASHILVEPRASDQAAWATARDEARRIAAAVGDDPKAFAAMARECSACPSAHQDGSLGQVRRGELAAEIEAALHKLAEGRTLEEPVRTRFGWHVLRLQRRIPGRVLPFEVVRERIAEMLGARSWSVAATRFVAELAQGAQLEGIALEPTDDWGNR